MSTALLLTAAAMGAAATPHCASMCASLCRAVLPPPHSRRKRPAADAAGLAPSAAAGAASDPPPRTLAQPAPGDTATTHRGASAWWPDRAWLFWWAGRLLAYGLGGLLAAGVGETLRWLADSQAWARPLWLMLQLALVGLGLLMLWRGQLPRWLGVDEALAGNAARRTATKDLQPVHFVRRRDVWRQDLRATGTGLAWIALPCGVLQAALVVAAMSPRPWMGALAMVVFALASTPGLLAGAWLWRRLAQGPRGADGMPRARAGAWALRLAGAGLVLFGVAGALMATGSPALQAWCAA